MLTCFLVDLRFYFITLEHCSTVEWAFGWKHILAYAGSFSSGPLDWKVLATNGGANATFSFFEWAFRIKRIFSKAPYCVLLCERIRSWLLSFDYKFCFSNGINTLVSERKYSSNNLLKYKAPTQNFNLIQFYWKVIFYLPKFMPWLWIYVIFKKLLLMNKKTFKII